MTETTPQFNLRTGLTGAGVTTGVMALFLLIGMIGIAGDAEVPVHWGINGEPDRFGSKWEALLTLPVITLLVNVLLAVVPFFEPREGNLARSATAYNATWIGTNILMAVIYAGTVLVGLGVPVPIDRVIILMVGALFMVLGNYLGKIRSNFFMGIRTPWTLSSERSWNRTHRLGGKLFLGLGMALMVTGALFGGGASAMALVLGGSLGISGYLVYYSWREWRDDPDKITPRRPAGESEDASE